MKKHLVLLFFFISQVYPQAPAIEWMTRYGGIYTDYFRSVEPTLDGGFILGGWSNSPISGNKTENVIGFNWDYWVIKTNSTGNIEWQKTIGGGRSWGFGEENGENLSVVKPTSDGGYLVSGYSDSPIIGMKTVPNYGDFDYWIVKLDSLGNILWQVDLGGASIDQLSSIEQTSDGGCIVGGYSASNISGNKTENSRGIFDYWVVKLDANGQIQWQKTIGGSNYDYLTSIVVLDNNQYLLAGHSASSISGDKTENSKGGFDFWIVKIDNSGTILWQKTIGGDSDDYLQQVIKTENGFLFGGSSLSNISFDKTQDSRGDGDYWIVKTNSTGDIIWDKTFGGSNLDVLLDVEKYTDNGYLLAGYSDSGISGDKTEASFGSSDSWLLRINEDGELIWQKELGGSDEDVSYSVISMPGNSIVVGSQSRSPISGNNTTNGFGSVDYWMVKLEPENLAINQNTIPSIQVYPNPNKGIVNINFGKLQKKATITLTNILGQKIASTIYSQTENVSYQIEGSNGIYLLTIENESGEKKTFKVIKN